MPTGLALPELSLREFERLRVGTADKGARHCGPVHEPAGARRRPVHRREGAEPGAGPDPTLAAPAPGPERAADARRPPARTTSLFAAFDVKTSHVLGQRHRRHRSIEFRKFLDAIDAAVPATLAVHLIMDHHGTHKTALIQRWFAKRPRFSGHFTPTYGSWPSLVERWLMSPAGRREPG
jgi:hypothetical protein